jgi:hypothetical protein
MNANPSLFLHRSQRKYLTECPAMMSRILFHRCTRVVGWIMLAFLLVVNLDVMIRTEWILMRIIAMHRLYHTGMGPFSIAMLVDLGVIAGLCFIFIALVFGEVLRHYWSKWFSRSPRSS